MQDAKVLSQRDIARLQNVIGRLVKIGDALMGKNGHADEPVKKRRRRRRTSSETPAPTTRRKRGQADAPPPSDE